MDWVYAGPILQAVAWPLAVVIVALALREPLSRILVGLGNRVTSVGIGQFKVELAPLELKPIRPEWIVDGEDAVGLTSEQVFDSHAISLFEQVAKKTDADYVVVDLKDGEAWLTSRLYIFAIVLGRVRRVRAFVFVANRDLGSNGFVGFATPDDIQRRLEAEFPRLEAALAHGRSGMAAPLASATAASPADTLPGYALFETADPGTLQSITYGFIQKLQGDQIPPGEDADNWRPFTDKQGQGKFENARWLKPRRLEALLGDALQRQHFVDSPDLGHEARVAKILRRSGDLIARLDEGWRFDDLIDRRALIEKYAQKLTGLPEA